MNTNAPAPRRIRIAESGALEITWNDDLVTVIPMAMLRRACPCATCKAEASARGTSYIPLFSREALTLSNLDRLGYYALQLTWKDGHNTGIYPYSILRSLGTPRSNTDQV